MVMGMNNYRKELTPVIYDPSAIKVLHFNIAPGKGCFRTHWHDRMEILRIRQGEMFAGFDTNLHKICKDELMIIPPHMPHKGFSGDTLLEYDVLMFDVRAFYNETEICKQYLPAIYSGNARFKHVTDEPELVACIDNILDIAAHTPGSLAVTAEIYRLIYLLLQHCLTSLHTGTDADSMAGEFISYIEANYAGELTTASLSAHFGYSCAHFSRKFKEATGLTPTAYIKIYRVEQAYQLIKKGNRSISNIALQCGFPDSNYFTRCFKAHFGVPPSHFL